MTPLSPILPLRRSERGGITWVTAVILAGLALAAWLVIAWLPVYFVHYEAKQTVRDFMNRAIKDQDDATLVKNLCDRLAALDTVEVVGPDGTPVKTPAIVVTPAEVTWERDLNATPPMLHVTVEYTRPVRYLFLEQPKEWTVRIELSNELTVPKW